MQKFIDFLFAHWETLAGFGGTIAGVSGWLSERKKRMRDNRDSDVAFWERTIDRQNTEIEKLQAKIEGIERRYEEQVQRLLKQVADLSAKLEKYETNHPHTL